jgi:hypothetical protein
VPCGFRERSTRTHTRGTSLTPCPCNTRTHAARRSSCFLCGPKKQIQNMTDRTRLLTTIVYVVFMILTLVAALKWKSIVATMACCIVQYAALTWYTLSYIPFARAIVSRVLGSAVTPG